MGSKNILKFIEYPAIFVLFFCLNSATLTNASGANYVQPKNKITAGEYKKNEIIVKFKPNSLEKENFSIEAKQLNRAYGKSTKPLFFRKNAKFKKNFDKYGFNRVFKIELKDGEKIEDVITRYEKSGLVEYANLNYKLNFLATPDDPMFSEQWHLPKVNAEAAWDIEQGDPNVSIAIIDSGVDWDHPDLAANIWTNSADPINGADDDLNGYTDDYRGWDFTDGDNDPMDDYGHGTHVAGIAAAVTDNATGVSGMAWSVKIMALKTYWLDDTYSAIEYAADMGASVINASWGVFYDDETLRDFVNYARDAGIIFVAAAGNNMPYYGYPWEYPIYPAPYNGVIAVAATNSSDQRASFSNYGSWVDISAPGENIYSTDWDDTYEDPPGSGTSYSTPLVAGIAALLKSEKSSWSYDRLYARVKNRADNIDLQNQNYGNKIGNGRINASKVVLSSDNLHPDGTLFKVVGDPSIYYLDGGKRHVPSISTFETNFRWNDVIWISAAERNSYIWGPRYMYPDGTLLKGSGPEVYVLEYHLKRHLTSPSVFNGLGYKWSNIIVVPSDALNRYSSGPNISSSTYHPSGTLVKAIGDTAVYLLDNGRKNHVISPGIFSRRFKWKNVVAISTAERNSYPTGKDVLYPDGTLLKGSGPEVYVLEYGEKRHISSADLFNTLHYNWSNILIISDGELAVYSDGPDLT